MTLPIRSGIDIGSVRIGVVAGTTLPVVAAARTVRVESGAEGESAAVAEVVSLMQRASVAEVAIEHGSLYTDPKWDAGRIAATAAQWARCQSIATKLVIALRAAGIAICTWTSADGKSTADWWPRAAWASRLVPGPNRVTTEQVRDHVLGMLDAASVERLMAAAGDAEERHAARGGGRIATDVIDATGVMLGSAIARIVKQRAPRKRAAKEASAPRPRRPPEMSKADWISKMSRDRQRAKAERGECANCDAPRTRGVHCDDCRKKMNETAKRAWASKRAAQCAADPNVRAHRPQGQKKCQQCGGMGHNKRTCMAQTGEAA